MIEQVNLFVLDHDRIYEAKGCIPVESGMYWWDYDTYILGANAFHTEQEAVDRLVYLAQEKLRDAQNQLRNVMKLRYEFEKRQTQ